MLASSSAFEIIKATIESSDNQLSVQDLCAIAGVSRSGYYAWLAAAPIREAQEAQDRADFDLILAAYTKRGYDKGARSIYMTLQHFDPPVTMNIKKIRRLMKKYRLVCPIRGANPYRQMAKALKTSNVAPHLLKREFELYGPRLVLLTDITYLKHNETFTYLVTIIDAFTKEILSYELSDSLEVDFVLLAVNRLIEKHGTSLQAETIVNSDQGCHFTSHKFIEILRDKNLRQSMSRKGNCWDNAPQESFFGHMKDHIKNRVKQCEKFNEVKAVIDDYMDYYNNERYQWDLAKLAPVEFYAFVTTGVYPLKVPSPPEVPAIAKKPEELGKPREKSVAATPHQSA